MAVSRKFALAIFGFVNGIRGKQRFSFVLLGAWLLTPFACLWLIGLYRPDYRPAYVLGVLVPYVILYAAGITALGRAKYPALVALLAFHGWVLFHTERPFAQDWRTSSQIVASDNIPIIVCPQSGYGALKYGNGTIRMTQRGLIKLTTLSRNKRVLLESSCCLLNAQPGGPRRVISLHDWQTIRRRCLIDKEPIARVAAETGYSRTTLRKYLNSDAPPSRQGAPTRVPQLEKYSNDIDLLLRETPDITAVRIQHLLKDRYPEFSLRERAVRRFVAKRRGEYVPREIFIRQVYQPGDQTQYDFCDVQAQIKGEVVNMHLFSARLSYSTAWFARCYFAEDQPALFDGIAGAAAEFGGVTADGVFDNATTAIDKVLKGRDRKVNATFAGFIGSYATTMQYAAPRKGNEKGGVEGVHGYIRDNFFRPLPSASSLEELNNALLRYCREERSIRKYDGVIIADRLEEERLYLRPLPSIEPRPCTITHVKINKFSEVRFKTNRYSVPSQYAGRLAAIEVFATHIRMIVDHECIAEHERIFGKNLASIDPMHYIEVLERKHRTVERAEMLNNPRVPHSAPFLITEVGL